MSEQQDYIDALAYYKARRVKIPQAFQDRISEYSLTFEVLVTAYNSCRSLEKAFSRELFPDEINVELNYAAMDWTSNEF